MSVSIREFKIEDVPKKVKWINDPHNNQYLHYDLPLKQDKTEQWFINNQGNKNRYDAVIEVDNKPVGLIGLINIDYEKKDGEYYITIGEKDHHGKNIAYKASILLLEYAFKELELRKVYLFTEQENISMQKLATRLGLLKESLLLDHSKRNDLYYNAYYYSIVKEDFDRNIQYPEKILSEIEYLDTDEQQNSIYIKRDDLISFSFGGNKARKAKYFFDKILKDNYSTVITYGSKFSNHCRVIANMCKKYKLNCIIVSPYSSNTTNFNRTLIDLTEAKIIECEIDEVSETINKVLTEEKIRTNDKAFFIPGGGHGNEGTQAYIDAYHEIEIWRQKNNIKFDYIFLASGTGTTQAGLILGNHLHQNLSQIIGISVARNREYGTSVIKKSILEYIQEKKINMKNIDKMINFYDNLTTLSYGEFDTKIKEIILEMYQKYGIALSTAYTGKAFTGMLSFIKKYNLKGKNILFINTGGVPLFFDDLKELTNEE